MPHACWSSQSRSGRSQCRSSSFTLQFRWRTGCGVRRHWDQPDHHPDGLQPQRPAPRADQYGQRVRPRVIDLLVGEIIVTLTYVTLVMRAGSDGGGKSWRSSRYCGGAPGRRPAMTLAALGLFGAALFFGETMITPAISPGSDQNSLNRGAGGTRRRRVGADNRRAGRRRVRRPRTTWSATTTPGREAVMSLAPAPAFNAIREMENHGCGRRCSRCSRRHELAAGGKGKP